MAYLITSYVHDIFSTAKDVVYVSHKYKTDSKAAFLKSTWKVLKQIYFVWFITSPVHLTN